VEWRVMDSPSTPLVQGMLRYLPFFIIFFLTFGILAIIQQYQPELMNRLLLTVDVFGISQTARDEQFRESAINHLPVTFEEKQVLLKHTVFLGASTEMVRLALGSDPKKVYQRVIPEQKTTLTYYIYYLPNDQRPTVLIFVNDKLEKAEKGSAIDWP
jgi:hypothetical protein